MLTKEAGGSLLLELTPQLLFGSETVSEGQRQNEALAIYGMQASFEKLDGMTNTFIEGDFGFPS